jgi:hypothetical protein
VLRAGVYGSFRSQVVSVAAEDWQLFAHVQLLVTGTTIALQLACVLTPCAFFFPCACSNWIMTAFYY